MNKPLNNGIATPVELEVWKDPQGYVLIRHIRDEAWLFFKCWEATGEETTYIGCLHFEGVWHLSSTRFSEYKSYPDVEESDFRAYYIVVNNSPLLASLINDRQRHSPDWRNYDQRDYKHWIVESHDFYTDIVAAEVSFSTISGEEAEHCFKIWEQV